MKKVTDHLQFESQLEQLENFYIYSWYMFVNTFILILLKFRVANWTFTNAMRGKIEEQSERQKKRESAQRCKRTCASYLIVGSNYLYIYILYIIVGFGWTWGKIDTLWWSKWKRGRDRQRERDRQIDSQGEGRADRAEFVCWTNQVKFFKLIYIYIEIYIHIYIYIRYTYIDTLNY